MARGVMAVAETQGEAEDQVLDGHPQIRVLRSREINLDGLPGKPLPKHWAVVVEHCDPEREAELPQHEDPEEEAERSARQTYLAMSMHPEMLISGSIEQFACPACGKEIRIELPAPREKKTRDTPTALSAGSICVAPRLPLAGRYFGPLPRLRPSASSVAQRPTAGSTRFQPGLPIGLGSKISFRRMRRSSWGGLRESSRSHSRAIGHGFSAAPATRTSSIWRTR